MIVCWMMVLLVAMENAPHTVNSIDVFFKKSKAFREWHKLTHAKYSMLTAKRRHARRSRLSSTPTS